MADPSPARSINCYAAAAGASSTMTIVIGYLSVVGCQQAVVSRSLLRSGSPRPRRFYQLSPDHGQLTTDN